MAILFAAVMAIPVMMVVVIVGVLTMGYLLDRPRTHPRR